MTVVNTADVESCCIRDHLMPSPDLAPYVAVAWSMHWTLEDGQSCTVPVLPNPCVQLAVKDGEAAVVGVVTGAFSATFTGTSFAFGLRFRPCGFQPFVREPASAYTDRQVPVTQLLPEMQPFAIRALAAERSSEGLLQLFEGELRKRLPSKTDHARSEVEMLVSELERNPNVLSVEDAARMHGVSARTLQRLFRKYVGVTPKWIIRRYRLKEAAARAQAGEAHDWAEVAQQLGYYDQSHLINDFKRMLGRTPAEFATSR